MLTSKKRCYAFAASVFAMVVLSIAYEIQHEVVYSLSSLGSSSEVRTMSYRFKSTVVGVASRRDAESSFHLDGGGLAVRGEVVDFPSGTNLCIILRNGEMCFKNVEYHRDKGWKYNRLFGIDDPHFDVGWRPAETLEYPDGLEVLQALEDSPADH